MKLLKQTLLLFSVIILSCGKVKTRFTDNDVFRYNESANIQTLDPVFARNLAIIWPCNQIFNGLVQLNDSLQVISDIAKKWKISPNGKIYTFTLRNDVYFHKHSNFGKNKTRLVNAQDFVYSFDRLLSKTTASPGTWIFNQVKNYHALNDSILQIQLKQSFPAFLSLLSMKYASVVPKEIIEDKTIDFRSNPIGTGPFQFKFWEENVKLVLRKNPLYYEKDVNGCQLPYLESIAITFLPDKQNAFLQFAQGKLDFISGLDASYKDELLKANGELQDRYKKSVKLQTAPFLNTEYLGFNMNDTLVMTKQLRKILSQSIDRKKMITYLKNGIGDSKTYSIIPNGLVINKVKQLPFDVQKAKQYINSQQQINNKPLEITLSTNASYSDIAEFLQREWQKLGIVVNIDVMLPSTLRQAIATNKISFFRGSWIADYPDPENYFSLFYSNNFSPNGPNYTHYTNKEYDELYRLALKTTDNTKRQYIYNKMNRIIADDVPALILYYDQSVWFLSNNISGLHSNPMNNLNLKYVKK